MSTQQTQPKVPSALKRQFEGVVTSVAEDKTVHVLVKTRKMHAKYNKQYTESKKYAVHDEKNVATVGDTVRFQECRPISKTKRWRLLEVLKTS